MSRQNVVVLNDITSKFNDPVGVYLQGEFVRIGRVLKRKTIRGKGRCYTCLVAGMPLQLWQDYTKPDWFIEI
ncbi:hypothetical protein LJC49_00860 [Ruminococcaceae bacterium OttesenSCG-928-I18]|nr:hypothetical protein [Ruminococcaceae bacterium OttesenSCG-928-I18]